MIGWRVPLVDRDERWAAVDSKGATVWFTGHSGAGKTTIAREVERRLVYAGVPAYVLDGDDARRGLSADLGFDDHDRVDNVRRIGEVARILADVGVIVLVSVISPFRAGRDAQRAAHDLDGLRFVEVHVSAPIEVCKARDPKGLYRRAQDRGAPAMSGDGAPYESPTCPDLVLETARLTVADCVDLVIASLFSTARPQHASTAARSAAS